MPQGYEQPSQPPSIEDQIQMLGLGGYGQAPSGVLGEVQQLTPEQIAAGINIPPSAGIAPPSDIERAPLGDIYTPPAMEGTAPVPYSDIGRLASGGYDPNAGVFNYPGGAQLAGVTGPGQFPGVAGLGQFPGVGGAGDYTEPQPTEAQPGEAPATEPLSPSDQEELQPPERERAPAEEEKPPEEERTPPTERIPLPPAAPIGSPRDIANKLAQFNRSANALIARTAEKSAATAESIRQYMSSMTDRQKIDFMEGRTSARTIMAAAMGSQWPIGSRYEYAVSHGYMTPESFRAIEQQGRAVPGAAERTAYEAAQREYMGPPSPGVDYPTEQAPRPPEDIPQVVTPSPSPEIPLPQPRPAEAPPAPPWDITNIPPPPADVTQLPPPWEITTPVPWTITGPPPTASQYQGPGGIFPFGPDPRVDSVPPIAPPAAAPSPQAPRGTTTAPSERTPSAPSTGGVDAGQGTGTASGAGYTGGVGEYPAPVDLSYFGGGVPMGGATQMAQAGAQMLSSVAEAKSRYPNEVAQIAAAYGVDIDTAATIFLAQHGQIASRQYGGPLYAGQPSLVGERGPEMFVPSQPGTVVPLPMADPRRIDPRMRDFANAMINLRGYGSTADQDISPSTNLPGSLAPMLPVPSDQQIRRWTHPPLEPWRSPDLKDYLGGPEHYATNQAEDFYPTSQLPNLRINPTAWERFLREQTPSTRIEYREPLSEKEQKKLRWQEYMKQYERDPNRA
jgi:hypothetical protein